MSNQNYFVLVAWSIFALAFWGAAQPMFRKDHPSAADQRALTTFIQHNLGN